MHVGLTDITSSVSVIGLVFEIPCRRLQTTGPITALEAWDRDCDSQDPCRRKAPSPTSSSLPARFLLLRIASIAAHGPTTSPTIYLYNSIYAAGLGLRTQQWLATADMQLCLRTYLCTY